jgi:hypothetical protein
VKELKGYAAMIAAAIGTTDPKTIAEVEDTMRNCIFHSTLDWQTKEQFVQGAREAYGIVRIRQRSDSKQVLPEDVVTAALIGVAAQDIRHLAKFARGLS